ALLAQYAFTQVDLEETPLPIVVISTGDQEIVDEPKITARMGVIDNGPGMLNRPEDTYNGYDGPIGIEIRGQSSQRFLKKGFGIETRDETGEDVDVPLLGFPEESDWVLHGPYSDKSLIRNGLAYQLASKVMDYAPRTRFVELIIEHEYMGVYLFTEKIKRDKNRVDVAKLKPDENEGDDLTGGYILRHDKEPREEAYGWISPYPPFENTFTDTWFFYLYPKPEDISSQQKTYIQDWITNLENILKSNEFADPEQGYRKYIDLGSFIDFMWINEITKNVDAYRLSTYMYKDKDSDGGKLKMGPVWDFNLGFANVNYCDSELPEGWAFDFNNICPGHSWVIHFWWKRLWQDPEFVQAAKRRWIELREGLLSDQAIFTLLDSLVGVVQPAVDRNFDRWPILEEYVWPNNFVGETFSAEVNYLNDWLVDRLEWMDGAIDELVTSTNKISASPSMVQVRPNPAADYFNFYIHSEQPGQGVIHLYNSFGQEIGHLDTGWLSPQMEKVVLWNRPLPRGIYYFTIFQNGQLMDKGKVTIQ
ncbi:MAG: CotH kinase family protein, partial [Bacteroidota bacterium]